MISITRYFAEERKSDGDEQLMLYASLLAVLEKEFHKMSAQIPQLQIFSEREHRKVS